MYSLRARALTTYDSVFSPPPPPWREALGDESPESLFGGGGEKRCVLMFLMGFSLVSRRYLEKIRVRWQKINLFSLLLTGTRETRSAQSSI